MPSIPATVARPPAGALLLLGFALGGFFDGILLHQVLQWHHLLSNVDAVRDLRMQILADGLFHALMYVLAAAALLLLWRARARLPDARAVLASALTGFGAWHVVDAVLSHWLTGIHRIRVDVPDPLSWDLAWLGAFGIVPLLLAWWLRRRRQAGGGGGAAAAAFAALVTAAGAVSLAAPGDFRSDAVVLFVPGLPPARAFEALGRLDARVRWVDAQGGVWAVAWQRPPSAWSLWREGALLAGGTVLGLGCVGAMRLASP